MPYYQKAHCFYKKEHKKYTFDIRSIGKVYFLMSDLIGKVYGEIKNIIYLQYIVSFFCVAKCKFFKYFIKKLLTCFVSECNISNSIRYFGGRNANSTRFLFTFLLAQV